MSLPAGVSGLVDEDELIDDVALDGHRSLYVTPAKAVTFRERSLFTEESVDVYPTDIDRLLLEEGKRQSTVTFEYPDGQSSSLELPTEAMAPALKALLASATRATGAIPTDETILDLYRFNELTVILTDRRLLKHVGWAMWAASHDQIDYTDVRNIRVEQGQVSTGVNIDTDDGSDRLKIPHDTADDFVARLKSAVCDFHGIDDIGVLRGDPDAGKPDPEPDLDRLRPLSVGDPDEDDTDEFPDDRFTLASDHAIDERIDELETAIERQEAELESLRQALEELRDDLSRGP